MPFGHHCVHRTDGPRSFLACQIVAFGMNEGSDEQSVDSFSAKKGVAPSKADGWMVTCRQPPARLLWLPLWLPGQRSTHDRQEEGQCTRDSGQGGDAAGGCTEDLRQMGPNGTKWDQMGPNGTKCTSCVELEPNCSPQCPVAIGLCSVEMGPVCAGLCLFHRLEVPSQALRQAARVHTVRTVRPPLQPQAAQPQPGRAHDLNTRVLLFCCAILAEVAG